MYGVLYTCIVFEPTHDVDEEYSVHTRFIRTSYTTSPGYDGPRQSLPFSPELRYAKNDLAEKREDHR